MEKLKNPKILQKYLNFESIFSKLNLEINKLNHSNYKEIIKSINQHLIEYNKDNDNIEEVLTHCVDSLIQKYIYEDVENMIFKSNY